MLRLTLLLAAVVLLVPAVAQANEVYFYEGNNFFYFIDDTPPAGAYTAAMRVSGSFELSSALPPNQSLLDISSSVLSFSFSDGRNTVTNTSSGFIYLFSVATDATGSISHWQIGVDEPPPAVVGEQQVQIETAAWVRDAGTLYECIAEGCGSAVGTDQAILGGSGGVNVGTWTHMTVGAPAVPALAPLGIATLLCLLGFEGYRRLRG
jgi:hypothetical protein